jgi:putative methionine-R-sulfoxide reductase with GAF domain
MQALVDHAWDTLGLDAPPPTRVATGHPGIVSWVGFYLPDPHDPAASMVLGPRRNKPACSPIGMHGACGRCFLARRTLVIPDIRTLGPNYIACDPRDQSELVIPCFDAAGVCWGILDVDSFDLHAFTPASAHLFARWLVHFGLTTRPMSDDQIDVL